MPVETVQADIVTLAVDAVVNAANTQLRRGAGVCGAIFAAAGPGLDGACAELGSCATGEAVSTPGFDLAARWIIHTVGPVWEGGNAGEAGLLASCYQRALAVADDLGARSVAFPAISTGVFGYPAPDAARIAVETCREVTATGTSRIEQVLLVAFDRPTRRRYEELLA